MEKNNKIKYNGNGVDNPSIHKNPLFIALKEAGVNDMTAVDAVLSATLLGSNTATKQDLANHPTKEDMKSVVANLATKEDLKNYPTKEDLRDALANYPTKEDLRDALANYPTKEDLRDALANYPTKEDLQDALANHPTKEDMKNYATKADLYKAMNRQTVWMVGTVIAVGIMVVGLLM